MIKIGSHCSMSAPKFIEGSVLEALSYNANALMIYTGAPQNSKRRPIEDLHVAEAQVLLNENLIPLDNLIIHAPYIINLANSVNLNTFDFSVDFLKNEIERVEAIGAKYLVLHPGSFSTATLQTGIDQVIKGLNQVINNDQNVIICLETMAGKGSEVGFTFEQLQQIIEGVKLNEFLGICMDTCHIHDAGYDLSDFDNILNEFDRILGLDRLKVLHINDSKNLQGAHKDRHENIGNGFIGLSNLAGVVHHPKLENIVKILETPWINDQAPYKEEIEKLRNCK